MSRRRVENIVAKPVIVVGNVGRRDHLAYIVDVVNKIRKHQEVSTGELDELECFCNDILDRIKIERRKA